MIDVKQLGETVGYTDVLTHALNQAEKRIAAVPAGKNLIDGVPTADWNDWDASDELIMVADDGDDDDQHDWISVLPSAA